MRKKKPQTAYILKRQLYNENSTREAVFKNYKDAKKEYEELLRIWNIDGFFPDDQSRIIEDNFCQCERGEIKIETTILY